jgi:hypothetical protein
MDPNACLARMLHAIERMDFEEAHDALNDYAEWIAGGGFPANVTMFLSADAHR